MDQGLDCAAFIRPKTGKPASVVEVAWVVVTASLIDDAAIELYRIEVATDKSVIDVMRREEMRLTVDVTESPGGRIGNIFRAAGVAIVQEHGLFGSRRLDAELRLGAVETE